jgi:hypothetical protein
MVTVVPQGFNTSRRHDVTPSSIPEDNPKSSQSTKVSLEIRFEKRTREGCILKSHDKRIRP